MADFATLRHVALAGLAVSAGLALLTWIASVLRRDASLVDRLWSVMIAGAALAYAAQLGWHAVRAGVALALVFAWAARLSIYVTWRNWGHGEDARYREIRARNEPHFEIKSLVLVFALQAVLAWIVTAPILVAIAGTRPIGVLDVVGVTGSLVGFSFEAIGDAQMAAFKRNPENKDRVMDRGLWRFTRHPNYFGEACFWWGIGLVGLGAGGMAAAWALLSPLLMTVLLLKVSGVVLLEKGLVERRPAYRDYVARTNAFIPGPPRRGKHPRRPADPAT